jgi:hypothetical protein
MADDKTPEQLAAERAALMRGEGNEGGDVKASDKPKKVIEIDGLDEATILATIAADIEGIEPTASISEATRKVREKLTAGAIVFTRKGTPVDPPRGVMNAAALRVGRAKALPTAKGATTRGGAPVTPARNVVRTSTKTHGKARTPAPTSSVDVTTPPGNVEGPSTTAAGAPAALTSSAPKGRGRSGG